MGHAARPDVIIREATPADAHAIATVQVRGWRAAYRGLIPQKFLDALSIEDRTRRFGGILAAPQPGVRFWVAERGGHVIGYASAGPSRDDGVDAEATGEVYALYLVPEAWDTGSGRALFTTAADSLRGDGFQTATLWVLEANERARRFYEHAGWEFDGTVMPFDAGGVAVPEVRYRRTAL
ncbi:hypothetical protein AYO38_06750 [bacterium SCGC AG-212-C10]|nr:hypothetical protein AYO38_06750 [bacterium SCGC AG-212-C10]